MRIAALFILVCGSLALSTMAVVAQPDAFKFKNVDFGRSSHFSGIYFSNFENSQFAECDSSESCLKTWNSDLSKLDFAQVWCQPRACADLKARIVHAVGSHEKGAVYKLDFVGRRSLKRRSSQYIGDTGIQVLIERIQNFRLLQTE